jgi:hypothetical protein
MTDLSPIRIPGIKYEMFKRCQAIKDQSPNGVPLNKKDRKTIMAALRTHPNAKEKFGPGIKAIIVDQYICGTRCFFAIRADDSIVDFSLRKCIGIPRAKRTQRIEDAMARFNYIPILQRFNRFMRGQYEKQRSDPGSNRQPARF